MAAVPLSGTELLVIESRRRIGQDRGVEFSGLGGVQTTLPGLLEEGVLVYTVDARRGSGQLPIQVAGDEGNGQVEGFPVLGRGESISVRGYTITVISDDGAIHTVSVTRQT